jgi:hypothetical protein
VFAIEADTVELEHLLEVARILPAGGDHSHSSVEEALGKFLGILIAECYP